MFGSRFDVDLVHKTYMHRRYAKLEHRHTHTHMRAKLNELQEAKANTKAYICHSTNSEQYRPIFNYKHANSLTST